MLPTDEINQKVDSLDRKVSYFALVIMALICLVGYRVQADLSLAIVGSFATMVGLAIVVLDIVKTIKHRRVKPDGIRSKES